MGIYSTNRHNDIETDYADTIAANESYTCDSGAARLLVDCQANDMAIFEAVIKNDMQTIIGLQEGTILESEVESLNEAAGGSFFQRIIDFFTKLIAKIKGIIKSFIAKITMMCTKDNKKLVDNYKKTIDAKNMSKFEYKFREKDGDIQLETLFTGLKNANDMILDDASGEFKTDADVATAKEKISKTLDECEEDDKLELDLLKSTLKGKSVDSVDEYAKTADEFGFKDEDTYTDFETRKSYIIETLVSSKKNISDAEKQEIALTKRMNEIIKYFEKLKDGKTGTLKDPENKLDYNPHGEDNFAAKDTTDEAKNLSTVKIYAANACYKVSLIGQSALSKALTAYMAGIKFDIKQCRAVWMKAVTFNPKAVKESAEFENLVFESAMDESL